MAPPRLAAGLALAALLVVACGRGGDNPVLGSWEIDRGQTARGAARAAEAAEMDTLTFLPEAIASGATQIAVTYIVEEGRVRVVRGDGRGEHLVELLPEGRIRVALPIGVEPVYRPAGS